MRAITIPIKGADHPNKRGPARRFGIALCKPGDPVELRPEPNNPVDPQAVAIYEPGGIQLGYVPAEKAQWFRSMMSRGESLVAIFQQVTREGGLVRVGLDGERPDLPPQREASRDRFDEDFPPDPIWDDD